MQGVYRPDTRPFSPAQWFGKGFGKGSGYARDWEGVGGSSSLAPPPLPPPPESSPMRVRFLLEKFHCIIYLDFNPHALILMQEHVKTCEFECTQCGQSPGRNGSGRVGHYYSETETASAEAQFRDNETASSIIADYIIEQ